MSPTSYFALFSNSTFSPFIIKGVMLFPFTGSVTVIPSLTKDIAAFMISSSVCAPIESAWHAMAAIIINDDMYFLFILSVI